MTSIRHLLNYMVLKQFTDKLKYIRLQYYYRLEGCRRSKILYRPLCRLRPQGDQEYCKQSRVAYLMCFPDMQLTQTLSCYMVLLPPKVWQCDDLFMFQYLVFERTENIN